MLKKCKTVLTISVLILLTMAQLYGAGPQDPTIKFEPPSKVSPGSVVELADLNGDGLLDLLTGVNSSKPIDRMDRYYLNNGTATPFQGVEGKTFDNSPGYTYTIVTGDINLDGHTDVVLAGGGRTQYYLNNGTDDPFAGVKSSARIDGGQPYATGLADINGDGYLDLHVDTRIYFHSGTELPYENVTPFKFYEGSRGYIRDVEAVDLNGDGLLDVVMASMGGGGITNDNRYFLNNGTSEPFLGVAPHYFKVKASRTQAVEVADMNGDGLPDVVFGNDTEKVSRLFLNNGSHLPFEGVVPQNLTSDTYWTWAMETGDLDNDGDIDVVTGNSQPYITPNDRFYLNNGSDTPFTDNTAHTYSPQPLYTRSLDLGDLNGDGYLDIVTANADYEVYIYLSAINSGPVEGYLPEVKKVTVVKKGTEVNISWIAPNHKELIGFALTCDSPDGKVERREIVSKETLSFSFNNLQPKKLYLITIKAIYSGNRTSNAKREYIKLTGDDYRETFIKTYGGSATESTNSIERTSYGGYIMAGYSRSTDIQGTINKGAIDFYVVKLDTKGEVQWEKMYGGSSNDSANSIKQTADGGYIVAGRSRSTDIPDAENSGLYDSYIVKLDKKGEVQWEKMYGGSSNDEARSIQLTPDGGYIVAGNSYSSDIPNTVNKGNNDYYLVKLDSEGVVQWEEMYGGSSNDEAHSIQLAPDGGYIVAGKSSSKDIPNTENRGAFDYYVVKLDSEGKVQWEEMYGGSDGDHAYSIGTTSDGGYIIAGNSYSIDIPDTVNKGNNDYYVVKLDREGKVQWEKMYGGGNSDHAYSIRPSLDGGYIVAGNSYSIDIPGTTNKGLSDCYIIKLDSTGNVQWQKMYGGSSYDSTNIQTTYGGGYICAGYTYRADIPGVTKKGEYDILVINLDPLGKL